MRGEHRPDGEPVGGGGDLVGGYPALGDQLCGAFQPAAPFRPAAAQLPGAVHLLGDVGQVEVRGEGTRQLGTGDHVHPGQPRGRRTGIGAQLRAHLLDQRQQRLPLLADQGRAQQPAEPADVGAQRRVLVEQFSHRALLRGDSGARKC